MTLPLAHAHLGSIPSPPFQDLSIGPLEFRMYGLMIALGVLAAVLIARRRWEARGGDPEDITTLAIWAVPAGLVGARLYHVITDFGDRYSGGRWWPDAFFIWEGGLGIPGGVLLGAAVGILVARYHLRVDWRYIADSAAPAIPVAQAIGRLGNWFNQELYGGPTDLPWALEIDQPAGYPPGSTFHPTFLYEGLWNLAVAGLIMWAGRRVVLRPGRWFAVYVVGYGLGRLWVESLRIDPATEVLGMRVNIWTALVAIAGGLIWLFWGGRPIDREATAELRAGGDPLAEVGRPKGFVLKDDPEAGIPVPAGAAATDEPVEGGAEPEVESTGGSGPAEVGADPVGEPGPELDRPGAELPVREDDAGETPVRVDPEEGA